jgi:hypothetical protein
MGVKPGGARFLLRVMCGVLVRRRPKVTNDSVGSLHPADFIGQINTKILKFS